MLMRYRFVASLLLLGLLALPALAGAQGAAAVTGTVIYLERIALPPTAQVNVQLQDVSRADAAATVLAEQVIDGASGPPYAFSLSYDPAMIVDTGRYAVRVQIKDGDQLLFTSTQSYPVITQGNPTSEIEIRVMIVAGDGSATPAPTTPTTPTRLPATGAPDAAALPLLLLALLGLAGGFAVRRGGR